MEQQIRTAVRLPRPLIRDIKRVAKEEGSTFSQFIRSAAIQAMNERKKRAA